jgi:hypothetical protein
MLRLQFRTIVRKKSFYFALLIEILITASFSLQLIEGFRGVDRAALYPAWYMWNSNQIVSNWTTAPSMDYSTLFSIQSVILAPLLASLPYVDAHYENLKYGNISALLTRTRRGAYYGSAAVMTFLGAFLIALIPYVMEQILLLIMCAGAPQQNAAAFSPLQDNWGAMTLVPSALWPFQMNHPYLYNIFMMILPCAGVALFAVLSFSISLYFHKNRFLILTLPVIVLWIIPQYIWGMLRMDSVMMPLAYAVQIGAGATAQLTSLAVYLVVMFLVSFLLIFYKCRKAKDVLV